MQSLMVSIIADTRVWIGFTDSKRRSGDRSRNSDPRQYYPILIAAPWPYNHFGQSGVIDQYEANRLRTPRLGRRTLLDRIPLCRKMGKSRASILGANRTFAWPQSRRGNDGAADVGDERRIVVDNSARIFPQRRSPRFGTHRVPAVHRRRHPTAAPSR